MDVIVHVRGVDTDDTSVPQNITKNDSSEEIVGHGMISYRSPTLRTMQMYK